MILINCYFKVLHFCKCLFSMESVLVPKGESRKMIGHNALLAQRKWHRKHFFLLRSTKNKMPLISGPFFSAFLHVFMSFYEMRKSAISFARPEYRDGSNGLKNIWVKRPKYPTRNGRFINKIMLILDFQELYEILSGPVRADMQQPHCK